MLARNCKKILHQFKIKYLQINSNSNWIRVNLDNGKITTKDAEIFYMIN